MFFIKEFDIFVISDKESILVNYLSGAVDIIDREINNKIKKEDYDSLDPSVLHQLYSRNYIFETKEEYDFYITEMNHTLIEAEKKQPPNFLLIPSYNCNLDCTYCYEKSYIIEKNFENMDYSEEIVDKLFSTMHELCNKHEVESGVHHEPGDVNVTLMGGEPLFSQNDTILSCIFDKLKDNGYKVSVITNGYELDHYIPHLIKLNLDFIQVTLDGTKENHDAKRFSRVGIGTFDVIIRNIEMALRAGLCVAVRTNVDVDNVSNLPELAKLLYKIKQKYDNLSPYVYILQDGGCLGNKTVINELESLKMLMKLEKSYPEVSIFRKTFHGIDFINSVTDNKIFKPKMSNCAACKNQYILDSNGDMYKCWFGVGDSAFKIGKCIPGLALAQYEDESWKNRNILHLKNCKECKYRYICGGGCASRTKVNEGTGVRQEKCAEFKQIFDTCFRHLYGRK